MTLHDLETLKSVDLKTIDRNMVSDIEDIIFEPNKSKFERITVFLESTFNPYFIKCGDTVVKMSFGNENIKMTECIDRYLIECINDRL